MRYALGLNNKALSFGNKPLGIDESLPILPPYTIRLLYNDGVTPNFNKGTAIQVSQSPNIWDLTYNNTDWSRLLIISKSGLLGVLGANTSGVTNMEALFASCISLTTVPLFDTSSVTDMTSMFFNCTSLTTVPLFDTSNVTNMQSMFDSCSSLITVPLFDTSSVTNMGEMFYGCTSLTTVPLFDTSSVTNMGGMLHDCTSLTTIPLFDTSSVTDMAGMFFGCTNVESGALALYQQASTQATPPSFHTSTFYDCGSNTVTGAAELAQIPTSWGGKLDDNI